MFWNSVFVITARKRSLRRLCFCRYLSVHRGVGHAWQGVCMAGGMHGGGCAWQGACMAGEHAWQGACMAGGVCMAGGLVWQGACMVMVGVCVHGGGCMACTYYGIQSMSGRYASYWNAFLFLYFITACFSIELLSNRVSRMDYTHVRDIVMKFPEQYDLIYIWSRIRIEILFQSCHLKQGTLHFSCRRLWCWTESNLRQ